MDRITEAFVWPVRDPDWLAKIVIIGIILIVPIFGGINGLGWMLTTIDRLRAGEEKLPPANFSYLGRGVQLFVVNLVYVLVLLAIAAAFYIPSVIIFTAQGHGSANVGLISLGVLLSLLAFSVVTLGSLAFYFATPAIILATDHGGIAGGLDVAAVVRRIRLSPIDTLIAGLMLIAAGVIGQIGFIACVIGVFFTSAYAIAMQAWIVRSYELGASTPISS
jgi:hypothetical protein